MKEKYKKVNMKFAVAVSELSHCERRKVGCIIVNDHNFVYGYNGTPEGWDNCCEEDDVTKEEVLHAESNALSKIAKSPISSEGASLFVTLSPCLHCAKMIHQAGIKEVYYKEEYRITDGIEFLKKCGIIVEQFGE